MSDVVNWVRSLAGRERPLIPAQAPLETKLGRAEQ
jgi:hypothetical protein